MENFNKPHTPIKQWATDDKPREKMLARGADALSATELLAILINNGTRSKSAIDLARELLLLGSNSLSSLAKMSLKDLQKVKGVGPAKAVAIKAALQLGILLEEEALNQLPVLRSSKDIAVYLRKRLQHESRESFIVVYLNKANRVLATEVVSTGGVTGTIADPKIIFKRALELQASHLILSHNHPSGNLRPSEADRKLTDKIKQAARLIDMEVIDHIIVSDQGYYSFADSGDMI
ncbi:RadC family protein [Phnomibacter ginsenosidimutans]|uniref:DNA repair protein RadC n=1 Tax=Phnomibacter ginsenosidimutans TaxID=2676868 RepID=A0A6I6GUA3_9BACT|nr:DNA repair protein RadC [Phnomibacter ginsenosidimutans]QGW28689.1 DNA repair protein RadC [Phnomibacter ginsenosidimutans]